MAFKLALGGAAIGLFLASGWLHATKADQLPGRLITFKKTFDGWWDVACDTAPDGSQPRCYVQYVDAYQVKPKLRAVMVDFLYRRSVDGRSAPVITFDVEPDLSFARDVRLAIIGEDDAEKAVSVIDCPTGKCVFAGGTAQAMLIRWSRAKALRLRIREADGKIVERSWPLRHMREILQIIAAERKARGLP